MISIVYIYGQGPAKWDELKYSLRSLETHLKEDFNVWVFGDKPEWLIGVNHVQHNMTRGMEYTFTWHACEKMELIISHPEVGDDFVYMYDDQILLKDITQWNLAQFMAVQDMNIMERRPRNNWVKALWNTYDAVKAAGGYGWNCETHLPRTFNKAMMAELFGKFKPKENRYLFSTLYFNHYFKNVKPVMTDCQSGIAARFPGFADKGRALPGHVAREISYATPTRIEDLEKILDSNDFLNYNDNGLTPVLKKVIEKRFPTKSRFER